MNRIFIRKRDGARYSGNPIGGVHHTWIGECVYLRPEYGQWPLLLRSHYKGLKAFQRDFTNQDGSPIILDAPAKTE